MSDLPTQSTLFCENGNDQMRRDLMRELILRFPNAKKWTVKEVHGELHLRLGRRDQDITTKLTEFAAIASNYGKVVATKAKNLPGYAARRAARGRP